MQGVSVYERRGKIKVPSYIGRLLSWVIDFAAAFMIYAGLRWAMVPWDDAPDNDPDTTTLIAFGIAAVLAATYFPIADGVFGRTLGKRLFNHRLYVLSETQSAWRRALRSTANLVFFPTIVVDLVIMVDLPLRQRLTDRYFKTIVIKGNPVFDDAPEPRTD